MPPCRSDSVGTAKAPPHSVRSLRGFGHMPRCQPIGRYRESSPPIRFERFGAWFVSFANKVSPSWERLLYSFFSTKAQGVQIPDLFRSGKGCPNQVFHTVGCWKCGKPNVEKPLKSRGIQQFPQSYPHFCHIGGVPRVLKTQTALFRFSPFSRATSFHLTFREDLSLPRFFLCFPSQ